MFNKVTVGSAAPSGAYELTHKTYVDGLFAANDAMIFKGTIGTAGTHTIAAFNALTTYNAGWTYRVIEAGTIRGNVCEIGDIIMVLVNRTGSGNLDADFTAQQTNIDGAVVGPAATTDNYVALFSGASGKVPAQLTVSPRSTNFTNRHPHCYWHSGAAWALQFYYDYYQYTGDKKFLEERAYPVMKEAAEFYEDFLIKTEVNGKLAFVPSYSPENSPITKNMSPVSINATMDISAAKQLLGNLINAAKILNKDDELQRKWSDIISNLPDYEVGPDGSFREWLWPGLEENHAHRHASHLYALYDEQPSEIVNNPDFVKAVEFSIRQRFEHQKEKPVMAFGLVQLGLASAHIGNKDLTQEILNFLAKGYWTTGMGSFHNRNDLFNTDISGGFPYLCASSLVYADPGYIRFFPARPEEWKSGFVKGLLLRGGIYNAINKLTYYKKYYLCF